MLKLIYGLELSRITSAIGLKEDFTLIGGVLRHMPSFSKEGV